VLRFGLLGLLLLLAMVAWVATDTRMGGMDAGPGTDPGTLGFFLVTWVVMMSAMMFPSISPMVLMYARMEAGRREQGKSAPAGATAAFVGGYLITWAAAGLLGYAIFELGRSLSADAFSWDNGGPYLAGGVLIAAAAYQLTPLKDACLRKCRSPLMFLLSSWRPGRLGALRMGIEHGAWCVGCCWALMAALFALGVMSLGWMAFIAALIAIEKLVPWYALANRGVAVLLLVLGLGVAFTPASVPGLTLPGSPEAVRAMQGMEESMHRGSMGGSSMHLDSMGGNGMEASPPPHGSMDGGSNGRPMMGAQAPSEE
jgi:predicted metal-binding membrane protein